MEQPPSIGAAQRLQPRLMNTVPNILDDQKRIVEEDLLGFTLANIVLFDALAAIAFIPIETFNPG